jgi:hypothetical protein
MNKIIIEKIDKCSLVKEGSDITGHDCWGNIEHTSYKYVFIKDEIKKVYDEMYVVHDGKNVLKTNFISHLPEDMQELLDDDFAEKKKEKSYKNYLKLKKIFENDDTRKNK